MSAAIIDLLCILLLLAPIYLFDRYVLDVNQYPRELIERDLDEFLTFRMLFAGSAAVIFALLYFSLFHASRFQATPGKMLKRIYVGTLLGKRLTLKQSLLRSLIGLLSAVIGFGGYLVIPLTPHKTALHDWLAHTVVLKGKPIGVVKRVTNEHF